MIPHQPDMPKALVVKCRERRTYLEKECECGFWHMELAGIKYIENAQNFWNICIDKILSIVSGLKETKIVRNEPPAFYKQDVQLLQRTYPPAFSNMPRKIQKRMFLLSSNWDPWKTMNKEASLRVRTEPTQGTFSSSR